VSGWGQPLKHIPPPQPSDHHFSQPHLFAHFSFDVLARLSMLIILVGLHLTPLLQPPNHQTIQPPIHPPTPNATHYAAHIGSMEHINHIKVSMFSTDFPSFRPSCKAICWHLCRPFCYFFQLSHFFFWLFEWVFFFAPILFAQPFQRFIINMKINHSAKSENTDTDTDAEGWPTENLLAIRNGPLISSFQAECEA